jgi:hypothetical protein
MCRFNSGVSRIRFEHNCLLILRSFSSGTSYCNNSDTTGVSSGSNSGLFDCSITSLTSVSLGLVSDPTLISIVNFTPTHSSICKTTRRRTVSPWRYSNLKSRSRHFGNTLRVCYKSQGLTFQFASNIQTYLRRFHEKIPSIYPQGQCYEIRDGGWR